MMKNIIQRILLKVIFIIGPLIPDEPYLKLLYRVSMSKPLDLKNPKTMNEKLQWLKIHQREDKFTDLVDKVKVKEIVGNIIGREYIIPTLKIWDSPNDLIESDIKDLPKQFVIKTNHSGGNTGVYICKDKDKLDFTVLKNKMKKSWEGDIYKRFREWPYKNVEKKILAEMYIGDDIIDYKFYCFNGEVDAVLLCIERNSETGPKFYFFDRKWTLKRYNKRGKDAPKNFTLPKPEGMDQMFQIASVLSQGFPFVRVDLYNANGKIYFGELTFFPASGLDNNRLAETDIYFGERIKLNSNNM